MTKQEAIPSENATIEDALNYFRNHCILCKSSNNCCNCEIGIAIECIEKQIPKKPNGIYIPNCPTCGSEYGLRTDDYGDVPNHCTECGQKLDWSDNE